VAGEQIGATEAERRAFVRKLGQRRETLAPSEQRMLDALVVAAERGSVEAEVEPYQWTSSNLQRQANPLRVRKSSSTVIAARIVGLVPGKDRGGLVGLRFPCRTTMPISALVTELVADSSRAVACACRRPARTAQPLTRDGHLYPRAMVGTAYGRTTRSPWRQKAGSGYGSPRKRGPRRCSWTCRTARSCP
jgi:hypothetical protein